MSRTHKDAPHKVRERRLGITDKKAGCILCEDGSERTVHLGFTAIFFAHEARQRSEFLERAEELGYSTSEREVRGYLGEVNRFDSYREARMLRAFEDVFDGKRAIYSTPHGVRENILWTSAGPSSPDDGDSIGRVRGLFSSADEAMLDYIFSVKPWVSHKENIFTVISVARQYSLPRGHYHYHDTSNGLGYLLGDYHCHCSWCEPDEKAEKTRVRAVARKLRNAFNSGDYDALEELASQLVGSSSGAYRDPMNC